MKKKSIRTLSMIAIMASLSTLLMLFEFPLGFAPDFYKIDFSEVVVLIGAFALGPVAGIAIEGIKILLNLMINSSITMGIGELANFLIGISLVVPASLIYRRFRTKKAAMLGLVLGIIAMATVGSILNAFVLLPAYAFAYHMTVADLVSFGTMINPNIDNLFKFIILAVLPFNLIKGSIVSIFVVIIYKRVSFLIKGKE